MPYRPQAYDTILINGVLYRVTQHPGVSAIRIPYAQTGRKATVYQLIAPDGNLHAFKVFSQSFRSSRVADGAKQLYRFAALPGLLVCVRVAITPQGHAQLIAQYPDLEYAVLMPWIGGTTWHDMMSQGVALTPRESFAIAQEFIRVLSTMEAQGIAHCDLSAPNVLITLDASSPSAAITPASPTVTVKSRTSVALVDVEDLYAPGLTRPQTLSWASEGYQHHETRTGLWGRASDRFAAAVLLVEMLGWCDERVRQSAHGEHYFHPEEMQQESARLQVLLVVLTEHWGAAVAEAFRGAWLSTTLDQCPSISQWAQLLALPKMGASERVVDVPVIMARYNLPHIPIQPDPMPGSQVQIGVGSIPVGPNLTQQAQAAQPPQAAKPTQTVTPVPQNTLRCPDCGRDVQTRWLVCPYCSYDLEGPTPFFPPQSYTPSQLPPSMATPYFSSPMVLPVQKSRSSVPRALWVAMVFLVLAALVATLFLTWSIWAGYNQREANTRASEIATRVALTQTAVSAGQGRAATATKLATTPSATSWVPVTAVAGTPIPGAAATLTAAPRLKTGTLTIMAASTEKVEVVVEIADTRAAQKLGLSYRSSLPPDRGLLYDFGGDTALGFIMDTSILASSVAFIAADGTILEVRDLQALDKTTVYSSSIYRYALEVNQGFFRVHNVAPGDHVVLPIGLATLSTEQVSATSIARAEVRATAEARHLKLLYGPLGGRLDHDENFISLDPARVSVDNFMAGVRFYNPYDSSMHVWDYGFMFRSTGFEDQYRLVVSSDKTWSLTLVNRAGNQPNYNEVARGRVDNLDVSREGSNLLELITIGETSFFLANSKHIATLNVSSRMVSGDIAVATGLNAGEAVAGKSTRYEDFTVWSPTAFSIVGGQLEHYDGQVGLRKAGVDLRDTIIEARFFNPYDSAEHLWDYGFAFRSTGEDDEYRVSVTSDKNWSISRVFKASNVLQSTTLGSGTVANLDVSAAGGNALRLAVFGETALLFINNIYITSLDVSAKLSGGDVWVGTGLAISHTIPGRSTRFENFMVWPVQLQSGARTSTEPAQPTTVATPQR